MNGLKTAIIRACFVIERDVAAGDGSVQGSTGLGQTPACHGQLPIPLRCFRRREIQIVGDGKKLRLWGAHLWNKGKRIVLTEGELDCLSVAQANGNGAWPVVSIPNGAPAAARAVRDNWTYLEQFDEIIIMSIPASVSVGCPKTKCLGAKPKAPMKSTKIAANASDESVAVLLANISM